MSDYRMDISGNIGLSEYSNIYDYLGIVDREDNFTITIDKNNTCNVNIIESMLKDNEFVVREQGYDNSGNLFINALKR